MCTDNVIWVIELSNWNSVENAYPIIGIVKQWKHHRLKLVHLSLSVANLLDAKRGTTCVQFSIEVPFR